MDEWQLKTETIDAAEAKERWEQLLNQVARHEARVMVEKDGTPVAALLSADDFRRLSRLEAEREQRFKWLDVTREAFKDVPVEELEQEVAKALADVRRKRREQAAGGIAS